MEAGGRWPQWLWRRRSGQWEGACGGWGGRGGGEAARGPFYRTSKAVGRWNAAVAAGERRGVPLMALRLLAAIMEWRTGGEEGAWVTGRLGQV